MVGGASRCCTASTVKIASTAPAAPSMWPVIDLVADTTARCAAASPSAAWIEPASATSPTGVDVEWALTCTTSSTEASASARAARIALAAPAPTGSGAAMWYASFDMPAPATSA
ncbi:hypothetical protein GCM10025868_45900 [Angustibacter aerolatus]|uniref:Uncharacterized protein n=1 Tax=Angustibacter aerolatus TaxID=1162965 RepID=A0ABQ6JM34_9ACTN|nr:hypothetical protein GCM10025868_45900 [Angustibacter aerolatus]